MVAILAKRTNSVARREAAATSISSLWAVWAIIGCSGGMKASNNTKMVGIRMECDDIPIKEDGGVY
ncbi:MAG: hypothetical protein CMJ26_03480 [Phycisphaerae bacterium]|nr:hypothetical protein [Phycisphaerae bacterium]